MSYYRWTTAQDVVLNLQLAQSDGVGATGQTPVVAIRRLKSLAGVQLDGFYWNSASFISDVTFLTMDEFDSTNAAGLYTYTFSQSLEQNEYIYNVYYRNDTIPIGFDFETHYFVLTISGSSGSATEVRLYESEPSIRT